MRGTSLSRTRSFSPSLRRCRPFYIRQTFPPRSKHGLSRRWSDERQPMNRFYLNKEYTVNCNRPWARDSVNYKGNHRNECHVRIILFRGRVPDAWTGSSCLTNFLLRWRWFALNGGTRWGILWFKISEIFK